ELWPEPWSRVTFLPATGLPTESLSVTVIVLDVEPSWTTEVGEATTVDCAALTPPALTVIAGVVPFTEPSVESVAVTVRPAPAEFSVTETVFAPLGSVVFAGRPAEPDAVKWTVCP